MPSRITVNGESETFGPGPVELDDKLKQAYGERECARQRYERAILNVAALEKEKFMRDVEERETRLHLAIRNAHTMTWQDW